MFAASDHGINSSSSSSVILSYGDDQGETADIAKFLKSIDKNAAKGTIT